MFWEEEEPRASHLVQGLWVIWVHCCPKVKASLDWPDCQFTQLSHYFIQRPWRCYEVHWVHFEKTTLTITPHSEGKLLCSVLFTRHQSFITFKLDRARALVHVRLQVRFIRVVLFSLSGRKDLSCFRLETQPDPIRPVPKGDKGVPNEECRKGGGNKFGQAFFLTLSHFPFLRIQEVVHSRKKMDVSF